MAYGFNTTFGTGATDKIALPSAGFAQTALQSFAIRANRHGAGGSNEGRLWSEDVGGVGTYARVLSTTYEFLFRRTSTTGKWSIPLPSVDADHSLVVTYDGSDVANDPLAYVDGAPVTVTRVTTPVGTHDQNAKTLNLGNRAAGDRAWDGMLSEFGHWNRLLSAGEAAAFNPAIGATPEHFPVGLAHYVPLIGEARDLVAGGTHTITGALVQPHPRVVLPRYRSARGAALAAAGVAGPLVNSTPLRSLVGGGLVH